MPDIFDEISEEKPDIFDEVEAEPKIRATPLSTRVRQRIEDLAPNLLSTEENPLTGKARGFIPALFNAAMTSPLDQLKVPETPKFDDDSVEGRIEKFPLQVASGVADTALGVGRFLTSPAGVMTAGVAGLTPLLGRVVAGAFAPFVAKDAAGKLIAGVKHKDPREITEGALLGAMGVAGAKHAITGETTAAAPAEKFDELLKDEVKAQAKEAAPEKDIFDEVSPETVTPKAETVEPVAETIPPESEVEAPKQPETPVLETESAKTPANVEAPSEVENPVVEPPIENSRLKILNTASKLKVSAPDGATALRGTDARGRVAVRPISDVTKANPFKGADIVKIESGNIDKTGKFKPMEGEPELLSLGAQSPSDVNELFKTDLAQLNDAIGNLELEPGKSAPRKAFSIGEALSPIKERAHSALEGLKAAGAYMSKTLEGKPVWTKLKDILGQRNLELSESVVNAKKYVKETGKKVKDEALREAITNYVDTGGNPGLLKRGATEGPAKYRKGYERALNLSREEKLLAEHARNYFEARLDDALKAGILEDGIENYIHRMYEAESPFKQKVMAELASGLNTGKPSLAKQRVYEYDLEAEAAGLKPVKDFIKRVAAYDLALNKAIADRKAVKAMMKVKMPDGRPMIDVAGRGTKVVDLAGETSATMIDPGWKFSDPETPLKHRGDFKGIDHPALRKWKWATEDESGKPVFVQGNVMVHPEALSDLRALLEPSRIRANPIGRAALDVSGTVKQTMLDLSLFHYTQIGVHGFEHRSFRPVPEIDFTNPDVRGLIKGGMTVGETSGRGLFEEGLAGSSLTKYIPGLGPKIEALKTHLFESYIPRLKVNTGLHALERNRKTYPKLTEQEVQHLTANQMNAAFGGLNYEMMGRSKTTQDVLRLSLLAPDFLEARARFAGQAGTWHGREQQKALVFGLVGMYMLARIMNKLIDDQYHMEPRNAFSVIYKGKAYGLRTVQGDIVHLVTKPAQFMRNRLNPVTVRPLMELINERDAFGRKRDMKDKLIDIAKTPIPISLKGLTEGREQSLMESMLNAIGVTEHRESPSLEMFEKVEKWKKDNNVRSAPGEFVYDRDKDPFRKIRLAAIYDDADAVKKEMDEAVKKGIPRYKIVRHFADGTRKPVTGSYANDKKFIASLSEDEKKTLAGAKEERKKVYSTVLQAR